MDLVLAGTASLVGPTDYAGSPTSSVHPTRCDISRGRGATSVRTTYELFGASTKYSKPNRPAAIDAGNISDLIAYCDR